jgi:hypothetical protein
LSKTRQSFTIHKVKNILENLQKILPLVLQVFTMLGSVGKMLKAFGRMLPWLILIAALGGAGYYAVLNYKDPYKCVNNEIYELIKWDSNVYKFKGGYCV